MNDPVLGFQRTDFDVLMGHLRGAAERVAFGLFRWEGVDGALPVEEVMLLGDTDTCVREWHVELTDAARARVLQRASTTGLALFEAHSHGLFGDPASFSPTDLEGLDVWVPHVRWRLPLRPYAAIVVGPTSLDGLIWSNDDRTRQLRGVIAGDAILLATGRTLQSRIKDG